MGDWFCYDDGRHWAVMIVTDAASRQTRALGLLLAFAPSLPGVIGDCDRWLGRVTAITWESHPDLAARETELHAEHLSASGSAQRLSEEAPAARMASAPR